MTPAAFRALALQFPDAMESAHMNHPDFRVRGRIFATLGYPSDDLAVVMLTPAEQAEFVKEGSGAFVPVKGAWGSKGCTTVRLKGADPKLVRRALAAAWARKRRSSSGR